jgi:hypothetical protein
MTVTTARRIAIENVCPSLRAHPYVNGRWAITAVFAEGFPPSGTLDFFPSGDVTARVRSFGHVVRWGAVRPVTRRRGMPVRQSFQPSTQVTDSARAESFRLPRTIC